MGRGLSGVVEGGLGLASVYKPQAASVL